MKLHAFHPEAQVEFEAEFRFYETQRPGFGQRFNAAVMAAVDRAREFPDCGAPERESVRKLLTGRFPFVDYYELLNDTVVIWAVMHSARKPGYWWQ
ncbi:MAG: type II toxin-antitoxin system RelE/ParE family toxin, partial [Opitutus sp.]|nr:type II toxin-antitoxin system RelE/ParE family toxin [Opitutus sp.]